MSCAVDIMYQSRSSCFAYPRSSVPPETHFFLQAAKKFGAPKMHEALEPSNSNNNSNNSSSNNNNTADYSSPGSGASPATPNNGSNSAAAAANGTATGAGGGGNSASAATANSSSTKDGSVVHKQEGLATDAQYISANCVLFTYYSGDISTVVDEHFSRALSQPSSYSASDVKGSSKETSPMSARNFPPSFWNSNYQSAATSAGNLGGLGHELAYSSDPYTHAAALHGLHQAGDPWHYSLSTQSSAYSHRQMHDLAAYSSMPGTSRFNPQYSSLLLQPSVRPGRLSTVPGQCNPLGKAAAEAWAAAPRYHDSLGATAADLAHLDSNYGGGHTYSGMGNMAVSSNTNKLSHSEYWATTARRQSAWQ